MKNDRKWNLEKKKYQASEPSTYISPKSKTNTRADRLDWAKATPGGKFVQDMVIHIPEIINSYPTRFYLESDINFFINLNILRKDGFGRTMLDQHLKGQQNRTIPSLLKSYEVLYILLFSLAPVFFMYWFFIFDNILLGNYFCLLLI